MIKLSMILRMINFVVCVHYSMSGKKRDFALPPYKKDLESMKLHSMPFILSPDFWKKHKHPTIDANKLIWQEEKFLIDGELNPNLKKIDPRKQPGVPAKNKSGGIYIFIVKSPILLDIANYIVYIGKVEGKNNYGLSDRFQGYYSSSYLGAKRSNIKEMFMYWSDFLYVKYTKIRKNNAIVNLENSLIDTIVPPINHAMGSTVMQGARDAFRK